eukprot:3231828-Alexandrium_andersonii.AAC.1
MPEVHGGPWVSARHSAVRMCTALNPSKVQSAKHAPSRSVARHAGLLPRLTGMVRWGVPGTVHFRDWALSRR